jgi:hypothetical protein
MDVIPHLTIFHIPVTGWIDMKSNKFNPLKIKKKYTIENLT